jgi:hypothetical protein
MGSKGLEPSTLKLRDNSSTHLVAGASGEDNGDDAEFDGDKMQQLPPPGDGRTNLDCARRLGGAVMLDEVARVLQAPLCRCNCVAHSSCTTADCPSYRRHRHFLTVLCAPYRRGLCCNLSNAYFCRYCFKVT